MGEKSEIPILDQPADNLRRLLSDWAWACEIGLKGAVSIKNVIQPQLVLKYDNVVNFFVRMI